MSLDSLRAAAQQARLTLSPDELAALHIELSHVLDYIDSRLPDASSSEDVQPLVHPVLHAAPPREDLPLASLPLEDALRNAPRVRHGYILVQRVL
ncbi:aspartyl/glutamyl-tRNA amidotransferase subunit C [bacterium]|nr:aspartyl/glutamyl-tRNA amidotransferase subunit C [bacterium]